MKSSKKFYENSPFFPSKELFLEFNNEVAAKKRVFTWKSRIFPVTLRMFAVFKSIHFHFDMAYMQKHFPLFFVRVFFLECLPSLEWKFSQFQRFFDDFPSKRFLPRTIFSVSTFAVLMKFLIWRIISFITEVPLQIIIKSRKDHSCHVTAATNRFD